MATRALLGTVTVARARIGMARVAARAVVAMAVIVRGAASMQRSAYLVDDARGAAALRTHLR